MTVETIKEFLDKESREAEYITKLSAQYSIDMFVKVDERVKAYIESGGKTSIEGSRGAAGCVIDKLNKRLCLYGDTVEHRLTYEYMEYLMDVLLTEESIDKTLYVVAYHYLAVINQQGYQLTVADNAPFSFWGTEMDPRCENQYKAYCDVNFGELHKMVPYIAKEDLLEWNRIFYQYGYENHATKHYSLLEYVVCGEKIIGKYELHCEFETMLNAFLFKYSAMYTAERICQYMPTKMEEEIIDSLVEI